LVRRLCLLDEAVEAGKGVGPQPGRAVLFGAVGGVELGAEVGEVGEGELARVGAVADAEEAELARDEIAAWISIFGEEGRDVD
jgi:hypothetical protein